MRHLHVGFLILLLSACGTRGQVLTSPDGGGDDAGTSDSGVVWRSCETLTAANDGEACAGDFYCSGLCPCGGEEIRCVDGRVEVTGDCDATCPEPDHCAAPDVAFDVCGGCFATPAGFYWDGAGCVSAGQDSCECVGEGCEGLRLYGTPAECEAAHSDCHAARCEATGGEWDDMTGAAVGRCGHAAGGDGGGPSCDCGPGRSFDPVMGCFDDASCGVGDLCLATGGVPIICEQSTECGGPIMDSCVYRGVAPGDANACDCGPRGGFDPEMGCVQPMCEVMTDEALCRWSGGTFDAPCEPTTCGRESGALCAARACRCGELEVFGPFGCERALECQERFEGEACGVDAETGRFTFCGEGSACCGGTCVDDCRDACDPACDGATGCLLPTFACGSEECVSGREYCQETIPGVPGPSVYECRPFPEGCATNDCACFSGPECDCRESGGDVTRICALP